MTSILFYPSSSALCHHIIEHSMLLCLVNSLVVKQSKCRNSSPDSTERFLDPLQLMAETLTECLKLEETNWMFLLWKHALRAGPEASSVIAGSWHPAEADGDGEAAKEQGPKQLHAAQLLRASFLRQCLYGWLKLPNAWVKWAVIYSKRIELRWEKKRIRVKERESERCFLLVHSKGKETLSLLTSLWQDITPLNTSLQGRERRARLQESGSIWRQTNAESFLFLKKFS